VTTVPAGPEPIGPTEHLETVEYWKGLYFDAVDESRELLAERDELRALRAQRQAVLDLLSGEMSGVDLIGARRLDESVAQWHDRCVRVALGVDHV